MKSQPLDRAMSSLLSERKTHSALRALSTAPPTSIDFSSNDFLSLSTSPLLKAAYLQELENSPNFRLGSGGSRLLDGNSTYAEDLEKDIAAFHGAPNGLLFNSGFDANSGFFSCVPQPADIILYDQFIHASVHEGMRLSRAGACIPFAHNSVSDLKVKLLECVKQDVLIKSGERNVFVAIESLYSMDGDLAPIAEIVEAVESLLSAGNGHVVVDEAHSNGIYGLQGRGIVCNLGLENRIFARLHTFGKGLACNGGKFDACSSGMMLTHDSYTSLFSADKRILDQLCQTSNLFNRNVIPIFSSDQSRLLAHETRAHATCTFLSPLFSPSILLPLSQIIPANEISSFPTLTNSSAISTSSSKH
jgi:8-amino-7-oxononanoate synthase